MSFTVLEPSGINSSATFTFANIVVSGSITAGNGNVDLGNAVTANYFIGNGSLLTGLAANYSNTNVAAYLPTYTGNISAGNANLGNSVTSNYFIGNGSLLTGLPASYSNTNVAAYLPTYTGNVSANHFIGNGSLLTNITGSNVSGQVGNALIAGTVYTNAQPNITSVGTLTSLNVVSNVSAGNVLTNNLLYANGVAWNLGGVYSNANVTAYLPTHTGNVGANFFIGNGSLLTGISATVAQTVSNASQPNITSVGTLSSLTVSGLIIATGNGIRTANVYDSSGTLTIETRYNTVAGDVGIYGNLAIGTSGSGNITAYNANLGNLVVGNFLQGTLTTAAQPNITSVGTLTSTTLAANANVTLSGSLSRITGANVVVGNFLTGTLTTAAQPNITSVGTLSSLTVTSNISSGNANLGNLVIGNFFSGNGSLLSSITGSNVSGQVSNALIAGTVYTNAQPNITSVGTLTTLTVTGNVSSGNANLGNLVIANFFSGNGSLLSTITGSNITGQVGNALIAGTVYTNAQPNITSVGTLTSTTLAANANITLSGNLSRITGANLISGTFLTGTLTTAAQPNITSLGTLTTVTVTGNVSSGNANLGNAVTANFFIGNGALLTGISTGSSSSISNGNSNISISSSGGNIVASVFGTANILTISTLGANITGNANVSNTLVAGNASVSGSLTLGSGSGGNLTGANVISANLFVGTLTTGAQPNITSIGALSSLNLAGNSNIALSGSLSQISGANLISGTLLTGTLTTGAQPNITSVGVLSSRLTVGSTAYTTVALGTITGSTTINTAAGTFFTATASGSVIWTFSNPISSPNMSGFILELGNGGIGTQTWPPNTRWPGGVAPTLTANGIDILTFITDDGGTNWRGVGSMIDSK